jgi:hypothetical protein
MRRASTKLGRRSSGGLSGMIFRSRASAPLRVKRSKSGEVSGGKGGPGNVNTPTITARAAQSHTGALVVGNDDQRPTTVSVHLVPPTAMDFALHRRRGRARSDPSHRTTVHFAAAGYLGVGEVAEPSQSIVALGAAALSTSATPPAPSIARNRRDVFATTMNLTGHS